MRSRVSPIHATNATGIPGKCQRADDAAGTNSTGSSKEGKLSPIVSASDVGHAVNRACIANDAPAHREVIDDAN